MFVGPVAIGVVFEARPHSKTGSSASCLNSRLESRLGRRFYSSLDSSLDNSRAVTCFLLDLFFLYFLHIFCALVLNIHTIEGETEVHNNQVAPSDVESKNSENILGLRKHVDETLQDPEGN